MAPKKWGVTVNKSYAKSPANNTILNELNREAQYVNVATALPSHHSSTAAARPSSASISSQSANPQNRLLLEQEVKSAIRKKITDTNLLQLPPPEIDSMTDLILAAASKKEVFDWCTTLMLEEKDAIEIIRMREMNRIGSFGDSSSAVVPSEVTAPPQPASAANTNHHHAGGGKQNTSSASAPTKGGSEKTTNTAATSAAASSTAVSNPKVLTVTSKGFATTQNTGTIAGQAPLNNTASNPTVGSGTKKRGANTKALANVAQLGGGKSLVIGKFFECGCFAVTHNFVSNCLNCGRIFCEQEMPLKASVAGSYAAMAGGVTAESILCYACGQDPNKNITYEIKVQQGVIDQMVASKAQQGYEEAVQRRDQLLQFARERSKRTTVVDDQGAGGIAYGSNLTWLTEEEIEAQEEKERKQKIADMHKHSGAYRIHLDIVNQAVSLGATAAVAAEPTAANNNNNNNPCAAASASAVATATSAASSAGNAWGSVAIPSAVPQQQRGGGGTNEYDYNDENDGNGEGDAAADDGAAYDSDEEGARRILPLPTLLQKLWYTAEDGSANAANSNANSGKWETTRIASGFSGGGGGGDDPASPTTTTGGSVAAAATGAAAASAANAKLAAGPTILDLKPTTHRGLTASKRVQNDYFEDDDLTYRVQREEFIFQTKRALLEEEAEAEAAKKKGMTYLSKKGKVIRDCLHNESSGCGAPSADIESFSRNGVGCAATSSTNSDADEQKRLAAAGAAMAAGGRVGDEGMCLSMHQPWASLLVAGIKIHEGRSWYSDLRGRLWIHAAAAKYSENEIEAVVEQHRKFLRANGMSNREKNIPKSFPTSCLLGYVNVSDVISTEEYNKRIPDPEKRQELGESGYVFMCEEVGRMLPFNLPMEGKHKIYKLERKVWGAARKQFGED